MLQRHDDRRRRGGGVLRPDEELVSRGRLLPVGDHGVRRQERRVPGREAGRPQRRGPGDRHPAERRHVRRVPAPRADQRGRERSTGARGLGRAGHSGHRSAGRFGPTRRTRDPGHDQRLDFNPGTYCLCTLQ